jgi:SOS-response transcriptional repressor LexA
MSDNRYTFKPPTAPKKKNSLDPAQSEIILEFIDDFITLNGYAPSLSEISEACYISTGGLIRHLDKLEAHGRITREYRKARSIRIIRTG